MQLTLALTIMLTPQKTIHQETKNQVIVLGMIHRTHRTSKTYSIPFLKKLITVINPDIVLTEIPPERVSIAQKQFDETGTITESRVRVFPEYTEALFPLTKTHNFTIIGTAGWTQQMARNRSAKLQQIQNDPNRTEDWAKYQAAMSKSRQLINKKPSDDPYWIHTPEFDQAVKTGYSVYNDLFNKELGLGGWDNINAAHYANIAKALDQYKNQNKRILITYGSAHKYWFLEQLNKRTDITLLPVKPFLDKAKD